MTRGAPVRPPRAAVIVRPALPAEAARLTEIASIASNNDSTIGDLIAEAMDKVGKDGVITVEEAKSMSTSLDVVEGMQFDRGYISPYFVTNAERMEASLEDAFLLVGWDPEAGVRDRHPHPRHAVGRLRCHHQEDLAHDALGDGQHSGHRGHRHDVAVAQRGQCDQAEVADQHGLLRTAGE